MRRRNVERCMPPTLRSVNTLFWDFDVFFDMPMTIGTPAAREVTIPAAKRLI
jgi:hypothetical protein